MSELKIPTVEADITQNWLAQALESAFPSISKIIRGTDVTEIGAGFGLMAAIYRVNVNYIEAQAAFPNSVVIKMSSTDPSSLKLAKSLDLYQREYNFYTTIQPTAKIRSPRLFFGAIDKRKNQFVLVLEDLCSMKSCSQLDGASPQQTLTAISAIARLHGQFWNKTDAQELAEAYRTISPLNAAIVQFIFRSNIDEAIRKFSDFFTPELERIVRMFGKRTAELMMMAGTAGLTYIHGDYRLDNMFFGDDDDFAVLDWQVSGLAGPNFDVAYFLTGSLSSETRREVEHEAIEKYCEVFSEESGEVLDHEVAWTMYRQGVLSCLLTGIVVSGALDLSIERSSELVIEGLKRTLKAIEELDAGELLDGIEKGPTLGRFLNLTINTLFGVYRLFRRST